MLKYIFSAVTLLSTTLALAVGPAVFSGSDVRILKNNLDLNSTAKILTGTADPTSVAQNALKGSLYLRTGASGGSAYVKTDNGSSTNWSVFSAGAGGGGSPTVATKTGNYNLVANDFILVDSSGGTFTLTLPTAVSASGTVIYAQKTSGDITAVTINTTSSQTIGNGSATSVKIATQGEIWAFISDGSNWKAFRHDTNTGKVASAALTYNGLGTVSSEVTWWERIGDRVRIKGTLAVGTPTGVLLYISLPAGFTIDSAKMGVGSNIQRVGLGSQLVNSAVNIQASNLHLFYDGSSTSKVFATDTIQTFTYLQKNGSAIFSANQYFDFDFTVPISGWSP